mgnify:CR=1 FL=1
MGKLVFGIVIACAAILLVSGLAAAAEVNIVDFPKSVAPGESVKVKISWNDIPTDKDYVLRLQLEDWDAKPPVCSFKDFPLTSASGETVMSLPVEKKSGGTSSAKFVIAALSKLKAWDDCVASNGTDKVVTVDSKLKFEIAEYPKTVNKNSTVKVKVAWNDVKAGNGYKLIVQLENWDLQPGIAYVATLDNVNPQGEQAFDIKIPADAPTTGGCRFVAALISKTAEWKNVFIAANTPKEVEIK